MAGQRVRQYLERQGVAYQTQEHAREYTAQRVAAEEHVTGWSVAKPVIVSIDDELAMIVVPAPMQVDLDKARQVLGEVRLADESEFADRFTDCERGAEPPFGNLYDMPVYLDESMSEPSEIVFRDGTHTQTMRMDFSDYVRIVSPQRVNVATPE